ncbi:MAG: aldolase/citrate lyase family protein [Streptosporangiales bacterium]|nr:aldolase/citrate lyase family protein [Streptosporangiales bacterium]
MAELRERLRNGERLIGTFCKSRDPSAAETLAVSGYDLIVADLEHSPLSVSDVEGIVRACDCHDVPVIARIPVSSLGLSGALLDTGVTGLQVSDVASAATAKAVRAAAHYPPDGARSLSTATRAARFGTVPAAAHVAAARAGTVLIGQVESPQGLDAVGQVIKSEVFDALFIGPSDLSATLGHPGEMDHPSVRDAVARAADGVLSAGVPLGMFCPTAESARDWARRGMTLLVISTDLSMLGAAARSAVSVFRDS